MQIISLDTSIGWQFNNTSSTNINNNATSVNANISGGVGTSIGVTFVNTDDERDVDYGWRIKYLFLHSPNIFHQKDHLIGATFYIHPFPNPYNKKTGAIQTHKDCRGRYDGYPTPFSFVLGSGIAISNNRYGENIGGYIEAGVAFFKWFMVNGEIVYRLTIRPNRANFESFEHSINIIFHIL